MPETKPKESLYLIEQSLEQLAEERSLAEAKGDSEAIAVIDKQIAEYLTKEAAKVTSYVALIRKRATDAAVAQGEIDRMKAIRDEAEADVDRLKKTAMEVMNHFGIRELKATPGGGLRIQGNGGLEPLEIADWPKDSSGRWTPLPMENAPAIPVKLLAVPDCDLIRSRFKRGESTPGAQLLERGEHLRVS